MNPRAILFYAAFPITGMLFIVALIMYVSGFLSHHAANVFDATGDLIDNYLLWWGNWCFRKRGGYELRITGERDDARR